MLKMGLTYDDDGTNTCLMVGLTYVDDGTNPSLIVVFLVVG